jgi:hypothetical protein
VVQSRPEQQACLIATQRWALQPWQGDARILRGRPRPRGVSVTGTGPQRSVVVAKARELVAVGAPVRVPAGRADGAHRAGIAGAAVKTAPPGWPPDARAALEALIKEARRRQRRGWLAVGYRVPSTRRAVTVGNEALLVGVRSTVHDGLDPPTLAWLSPMPSNATTPRPAPGCLTLLVAFVRP